PFEVGGKGFVPLVQSSGVLIAYATAPDKTASDAGVYARILADELVKPNVESVSMFRNVQLRVNQAIGQSPWFGPLAFLPEFFFGGRTQDVTSVSSPHAPLIARIITAATNLNDLFNDEFRTGLQRLVANAGFKNLRNITGDFIEARDNRNIYKIRFTL